MSVRVLIATFASLLALAPGAAARVTATVSDRVLVIDGTALHDEIVVRPSGTDLRVADKDRVNPNAGCTSAGPEAVCPRAAVDKIRIDAAAAADSVQVNAGVFVPAEILGGNGDDTLSMSTGVDGNVLDGQIGNDTLHGSHGDDELKGGPGDDALEGDSGTDKLLGDAGADTLRGGFGQDELFGSDGPDTLIGDQGSDTAAYNTTATVIAAVGGTTTGNGNAEDGPGDTIDASVENLKGSLEADIFKGGDGPNVLDGGPGDDTLDGRGGDDVLKPGPGVDLGAGGPGRDTASYEGLASPVTIALGTPGGSGSTEDRAAGGDTFADVEDAEGGTKNDVFLGAPGNNVFHGGPGFDTVTYEGRDQPITADADGQADDGEPGEGDNIGTDVEGITGGKTGDDLTATGLGDGVLSVFGANGSIAVRSKLDGGPGPDGLSGSDTENDYIVGGPGEDGLIGRGGRDVLEAQGDGEKDFANCGDGEFDFAKLDLVDGFEGCEAIQLAAVGRHPTVAIVRAALAKRVLRVGLRCPRDAAGACRGRLEVALVSGARQAGASFDVPRGARRTVRVPLGSGAARRLRSAGRVRLTAIEKDPEGRPKTSRTVLRVRAR